MIKVDIFVTLKEGVLDPQGKAITHALEALDFKDVTDVRVNKMITLTLKHNDKELAMLESEKMCEELLANTVIENYSIKIVE